MAIGNEMTTLFMAMLLLHSLIVVGYRNPMGASFQGAFVPARMQVRRLLRPSLRRLDHDTLRVGFLIRDLTSFFLPKYQSFVV